MQYYDVIVIGAGAAGLMAAITAAKRGKKILVIESTNRVGEKIRISGGGRCNFTNLYISADKYLCQNPHFIKSALASFTQHDFIQLITRYNIAYHEKTLGQLFCDDSALQIINMFLDECRKYQVEIVLNSKVQNITKSDLFNVISTSGSYTSNALIIATGGLSIPKIGASDFGYQVAKDFGLSIVPTRPALVPLIVADKMRNLCASLSGVSVNAKVKFKNTAFEEGLLFTHRGLSGPSILQISSYLEPPSIITANLLPNQDLTAILTEAKNSKFTLSTLLKTYLPNRFVDLGLTFIDKKIAEYKTADLQKIAASIHAFTLEIQDTEGYAKAEVTYGGVNTNAISSKTMEVKTVPGLYFVGEVLDVTGWLGGYNFQWAWSSGYAAGSHV